MTIDWFTFIAQIINFLILVGLLRWLLYGPIIAAMNQRETKISRRWNDANEKLAEANETVASYQQQMAEFEQQREAMLQDARRESNEHRERLTREARDDVEQKRSQWLDGLTREQAESADEVRESFGEMAMHSARHTLMELADADLETRVVEKFIQRIKQMDDARRDEITTLLADDATQVRIRSAFELPDDVRDRLCAVVRETLGYPGEIAFQRSADLICGIQLDAGGYSIRWNVDDFVRGINADFATRLGRHG
ncbi:ATP synthase subunit b [Stieleria neptunia]|uniref:ATP synthase subunit b n=1 Tax=Stieleria neptunia TaxID=2527979 RepID=A0A518HNP3_9BACT|nr:hypothetical protein [Stieleria neptunia]QDV42463.1 ATP synthase subunit b [Stieleria neptunia]